ncbi:hypothetical protein H4S02_008206 [Coemansia sp. RSA 2611]|nr:hypothetical protein H4S02_008206 [Coemansia sp. RSA 2611]
MDRTESLATASYGTRSQFEREKERLVVEINQGMDTVNKHLVQLNQNLESAIALSTNFDRIARLWNEFGVIINPPAEDDGPEEHDVEDMDADAGSLNDEAFDEGSDHSDANSGASITAKAQHAYAESTLMDEDE